MKIINQILYLEFRDAADAGISENTIRIAKNRNSASWSFIKDPEDARKLLINYESLAPKYKALIAIKFGNPYVYVGQNSIKNHIKTDHRALTALTKHRFPNGNALTPAQLTDLSQACNILNFLSTHTTRTVKKLGFDGMPSFYNTIITVITAENIQLPKTYSRLREAVRKYETGGALSLISNRFGNQNSRKITDGVCIDLLLEMIGHEHQFDASYIAKKYNQWAIANNQEEISRGTVIRYKQEYELQTLISREGERSFHNKFGLIVHRKRPSQPLLLINSDDNDLDLYFIDKAEKTAYKRFKLVVVMDAFNDYPLGYAIGNSQTVELVRAAYLDAIHHIHDITGEWRLWHEIKADRWGLKALGDWYNQQATFTPAQARNARGKVIEQAFGYHWHSILKQFPNYAGHNVKAKESLDNNYIEKRSRHLPDSSEAPEYIAEFFNKLRNIETKSGKTRQQEWLEAFNASTTKRELSHEERLLLFGLPHKFPARLRNSGLNYTISGKKANYFVAKEDYLQWVGSEFNLFYDPYLPQTALAITEDGTGRILVNLLTDSHKIPMAIMDRKEGDGLIGYNRLQEQKFIMQYVLNARNDRKERLAIAKTHAESVLQAGVLIKEIKQQAEQTYVLPSNAEDFEQKEFNEEDWLNDNL